MYANKDDEEVLVAWFRNKYECSECAESWENEWSCMCNDHCPTCNREMTPSDSEDLSEPPSLAHFEGIALSKLKRLTVWKGLTPTVRRAILKIAALSVSVRDAKRFAEKELEMWGSRY
jgi:hypothetical protein